MREFGNYIDGEVRPPRAGAMLDSVDPSIGQAWARIPASDAADVDDAVAAARTAFETGPWPRMAPLQRSAILRAWAAEIAANAEELSALETRDNGRALRETRMGDLPG